MPDPDYLLKKLVRLGNKGEKDRITSMNKHQTVYPSTSPVMGISPADNR